MKKIMFLMALLFLCITTSWAASPDSRKAFQFTAAKMDMGTVYHYFASDIEGKYPIDIFAYVKSTDEVVLYRDYTSIVPNQALLQTVHFNWDHMMADNIVATNPLAEKYIDYKGISVKVDFAKKSITTKENIKDKDYINIVHYSAEPCFSYEIFHIDLQFALRFLNPKSKAVDIQNYMGSRFTDAVVRKVGVEKINDTVCIKYEMKAKGILATLANAKAYIWLAQDDPRKYAVKYINYVQRDGLWKTCKLELMKINKSSSAEWEEQVRKLIDAGNQKLLNR